MRMRPWVVMRISFSLMAAASGRGFSTRWYRSMALYPGDAPGESVAVAAAALLLLKGDGEGKAAKKAQQAAGGGTGTSTDNKNKGGGKK